jgi:hypothetical protein
MQKIIITDLTRFSDKNPDLVCIAGIDKETGQCIRPMPYLKKADCQNLKIRPGAILSGVFTAFPMQSNPHCEDRHYQYLRFEGLSNINEFKTVLNNDLSKSLEIGFEISLNYKQRYIPVDRLLNKSIITIKVNPHHVCFIKSDYKTGGKLNFIDNSGRDYRFFPITDLTVHQIIEQHQDFFKLNAFLHAQSEVYLRIGLSRCWKKPNTIEEGYWLQINGIYTFPHHLTEII